MKEHIFRVKILENVEYCLSNESNPIFLGHYYMNEFEKILNNHYENYSFIFIVKIVIEYIFIKIKIKIFRNQQGNFDLN